MRIVFVAITSLLLAGCGQPDSEAPSADTADVPASDDAAAVEGAADAAEGAVAAAADAADAADAAAGPDDMTGSARPSSETPAPKPGPKPESKPRPTTGCARPSDC